MSDEEIFIDPEQMTSASLLADKMGARRINYASQVTGLTPQQLVSINYSGDRFRTTNQLTLALEIEERDDRLQSLLRKRKSACTGLDGIVTAPTDDYDQNIIDACNQLTKLPWWVDMQIDILDAIHKGWSVLELIWNTQSDLWIPKPIYVDQRWTTWNEYDGMSLHLVGDGNTLGEEIIGGQGRYIIHRHKSKSGQPHRGGLMKAIALTFIAKAFAKTDRMLFMEKLGIPLVVMRHKNQTAAIRSKLEEIAQSITSDGAAIIPADVEIEFQSGRGVGIDENIYQNVIESLNDDYAILINGQTMTTTDGSSRAQAEVMESVQRDQITKDDARQLCATITEQLIKPFVIYNFGYQKLYPYYYKKTEDEESIHEIIETHSPLIDRGMKFPQSYFYDKLGMEIPEGADPNAFLHPVNAAPIEAGSETTEEPLAVAENQAVTKDLIADLTAAGLADWSSYMGDIIEDIETAINNAESFDGALENLVKLTGKIPTKGITDIFREQFFKAHGVGDAQDKPRLNPTRKV